MSWESANCFINCYNNWYYYHFLQISIVSYSFRQHFIIIYFSEYTLLIEPSFIIITSIIYVISLSCFIHILSFFDTFLFLLSILLYWRLLLPSLFLILYILICYQDIHDFKLVVFSICFIICLYYHIFWFEISWVLYI